MFTLILTGPVFPFLEVLRATLCMILPSRQFFSWEQDVFDYERTFDVSRGSAAIRVRNVAENGWVRAKICGSLHNPANWSTSLMPSRDMLLPQGAYYGCVVILLALQPKTTTDVDDIKAREGEWDFIPDWPVRGTVLIRSPTDIDSDQRGVFQRVQHLYYFVSGAEGRGRLKSDLRAAVESLARRQRRSLVDVLFDSYFPTAPVPKSWKI